MTELAIDSGYSVVWMLNLQDYFNELTGATWHWADGEEFLSQDSYLTITADPEWEPEDEEADMLRYLEGGHYSTDYKDEPYPPGIEDVMQYLCRIGKIPAGKYIVTVWW